MLILQIIVQYNAYHGQNLNKQWGIKFYTTGFNNPPPLTKTQYIGIQRPVLDLIKHLKTGKNISDNQTR